MRKVISALVLGAFSVLAFGAEKAPELDPAGLNATLKAKKWALVEFGGETCLPCVQMQPILMEVKKHYGDKVNINNFYVSKHKKAAAPYKVMIMPTQVVFNPEGKEVLRHVGIWPKEQIIEALGKAGVK